MTNDKAANLSGVAIEGNTFTNYPEPPVVETRQPAEVVAVLEQAADHAGASAATYRQLAALIRDRPAAAAAVAAGSVDIVKAMRDAYGRGFMVGAQQVQKGGAPYATNDYAAKCRAWIAQYIVRMPMVGTTDIEALRLKLEGALEENAKLRQQISDIYNAQNG